MTRKILLAALTLAATLALTGCAGLAATDPGPAPSPGNTRERLPDRESVVRPYVDGTELTCIRDEENGSVSCNWEAWNQARNPASK